MQQLRAEKVSVGGGFVGWAGVGTVCDAVSVFTKLSSSDFLSPRDSSQYGDNLC